MSWAREQWSEEAADVLAPALNGDGDFIRCEVESGQADLYRVDGHGFIVTRLEQYGNEFELVLVAWAGKDTGPIVEHVQRYCRYRGVKSIRFHSRLDPKVVARMVKKWGFEPVETVYRWVA